MNITGVLETSLYVDDVARSADFYTRLLGFGRLDGDARFCALSVAGRHVLLLFLKGATLEPIQIPGGIIPPHDGSGNTHLAFSVPASDLDACDRKLVENAVAIESRVSWPRGGHSIYFRDPDNHLVELITPGCWAIY